VPHTNFCPNCHERISARARFCPSCGASQEEFAVPPADAAPKPATPPPPGDLWSAGGPATPPPRQAPARFEPPLAESSAPAPPPAEPAAPAPPPVEPSPPAPTRDPPTRAEPAPPPVEPSPPAPTRDPPARAEPAAPARDDAPTRPDDPPRRVASPPREQASEFSGALRERLALPGFVAAGIAAAISAGVVLLAGLLIAVITPDNSIIGAAGFDAGVVKETFRQAVGTLLTAMVSEPGLLVSGSRRLHPLVLVAIPLAALIFSTRSQLHRTEGAPPLARLGWAALVAVPFALLMLVFAVIGGKSDVTRISPSVGGAFGLGLLWGAIGGLIGAATKLGLASITARVPRVLRTIAGAALATLRPLAVVLAVCTVVGLAGWLIQVGRDAGGVRSERSAPTALIEEATFAGEHGIHLTALAAGASFTADGDGALGLPFPVADADEIPGRGGTFRVFAYRGALPTAVLLPALVLLMGLVALGALYGGFAAARAVKADSLRRAALWGAVTGPAWAIAMAILVLLAGGLFHGDADDTSVFGVFLLGGAIFGAAGGALNAQAPLAGPASSSS
jgi:hypothetical protein